MTQAGWNGDVRPYADGNDTPVADVLATRSFTTSSGAKRTLLAQRALRDSQPDRTTVEYPIRFIREDRKERGDVSSAGREGPEGNARPCQQQDRAAPDTGTAKPFWRPGAKGPPVGRSGPRYNT